MEINRFSEDVAAKLQHYVYVYVDEEGKVVYVGRGSTADRAFSHLSERIDDGKSHNWQKLECIDKNTSVYIVHSGMSLEEAQHCETALINLCRFQNNGLANEKEGDKYKHMMLEVDKIQNTLSSTPVLLEEIFSKEERAAVLAYSEKRYFKSPKPSEDFFEKLQHEDGFRLFTSEIDYKEKPPKVLCIIHDSVIRGIYLVESEIQPNYVSESAYAYITFELDEQYITPEKYKQFIGRRIEKKNSRFSISERRYGNIHFLY